MSHRGITGKRPYPDYFNDIGHYNADEDDEDYEQDVELWEKQRKMFKKCFSRKPYKCSICKKVYNCHEEKKALKCSICDDLFNSKKCLKKHVNADHADHENWEPYKCSTCKKVFCQESSLNQHSADVHEEKKATRYSAGTETENQAIETSLHNLTTSPILNMPVNKRRQRPSNDSSSRPNRRRVSKKLYD